MMALTGVEQDDWSMEFDAEHVHIGLKRDLVIMMSNKMDDYTSISALMATNFRGSISRSTDGSYYPRMDSRRPSISSYSPSSRSSTTRTPHRPQRPKKIVKSIWVKKGSTVGSQAVLPQTGNPEEDLKDYAIIDSGALEATEDEAVYGIEDGACQLQKYQTIRVNNTGHLFLQDVEERTVREPLELLHMDLFGPVSVESVNRKKYCLVVTDDCSKFSWDHWCVHGTEFKNQLMNEFCAKKGIKREYSIARTPPQQNVVAEKWIGSLLKMLEL
ncbi:putative ribonuclease H-like domain-containing protein [Tanacetum coccineum]